MKIKNTLSLLTLVTLLHPAALVQADESRYLELGAEFEASDLDHFESDELEFAEPLEAAPIQGALPFQAKLRSRFESDQSHWGYNFVWVAKDGHSETIASLNPDKMLVIASTMKLFTAWYALEKNYQNKSVNLGYMLRSSINHQAIKTLNDLGSTTTMRAYYHDLASAPIDSTKLKVFDGAGLDTSKNLSTADTETDLLQNIIYVSPRYHEFSRMLAKPGLGGSFINGTLRNRLPTLRGSLYAKTGSLPAEDTASLAGYLEFNAGTLIFSILTNESKVGYRDARELIDQTLMDHATYIASHFNTKLKREKIKPYTDVAAPALKSKKKKHRKH